MKQGQQKTREQWFQSRIGKKERVRPYPFEVTSEMAVDFKYDQSDLEYLACRQVVVKMEDDTEQKVERLTMYRPQWTVVLQQLTEKEYAAVRNKRNNPALNEKFPENIEIPSGWLVNINNAIYEAIIPKAPRIRKNACCSYGIHRQPRG